MYSSVPRSVKVKPIDTHQQNKQGFTFQLQRNKPIQYQCNRVMESYQQSQHASTALTNHNAVVCDDLSTSESQVTVASNLTGRKSLGSEDPALVVFSGGTAFNSVAGSLRTLTNKVVHVLPVSDDGGSTAEIVRVLGGPAVGDIRSRCLRLAADTSADDRAVKRLLAHRLPAYDSEAAKREWYSIVEGEHELWSNVSEPYKHVIRQFLVHFNQQVLASAPSGRFSYRNGSIGNFFFAGARVFFHSLESAIFMFSKVAGIPEGSKVLPSICTEERITLGAELADGTLIRGQNNISHPNNGKGNIVDKDGEEGPRLHSPIKRVFYLSQQSDEEQHEVSMFANIRVLNELASADTIIYGMGSVWTSICPCLTLKGVGERIGSTPASTPKILCLNGSVDRETECALSHAGPMDAYDIVQAITDTLNRKYSRNGSKLEYLPSNYINALLVPMGGEVIVDRKSTRLNSSHQCASRMPSSA
eukprot:TRINITY_DN3560_c2_g2_i1.p1 TRINITY_DN3560_c2_g2~~TRINITY_DN3560_c2_g2_i1.p1  ORF type:complete len:505 (-),score=48.68 TRINITY_DN3560_c2_g2_i1:13-1434(-)